MNTQQNMEDRLWDYIDGTSSVEERSFIEQLLESNREWRAKYKELLDVHQLMSNHIELDEPSMRFTQNVMENISKHQIAPAAKSYINKRVIWGIGSFFILSIVGFLIYGIGQMDWVAGSSGGSIMEGISSNINKVDFNKYLTSTYANIFLLINIVLGLVYLDMYLGKKKKQWKSQ
jgi:regulatory protein YycI of two-component signal transduction system YycFG